MIPPNKYSDSWGLIDEYLQPVFDVDSCFEVGYKGNAKVSQFPVETGGFVNYNKVETPFKIKLTMAVGGDSTRISAFLTKLEAETKSIHTYSIVTPEAIYRNATIEGYNYKRTSEKGRNMVVADIELVEVREVAPAYTFVHVKSGSTKKKDSDKKKDIGKQQAKEIKKTDPFVFNPAEKAFTDSGVFYDRDSTAWADMFKVRP